MSVLSAYPPNNDDETILRGCIKKCGYITSTEDQQFFALGCLFCAEKFLYFDAYIGHMQREHAVLSVPSQYDASDWTHEGQHYNDVNNMTHNGYSENVNEPNDFADTNAALLVMVKQELPDEDPQQTHDAYPTTSNIGNSNIVNRNDIFVKQENGAINSQMNTDSYGFFENQPVFRNNDEYVGDGYFEDDEEDMNDDDYDDEDNDTGNYDDLVEQSLLQESDSGLALHIKDRKMIQFVIDQYRRNPYLWDHRNPSFRDRKRRSQFLNWMLTEFKRRFNVSLARDAITRKWDNLRTVYKRECNRMSMERSNVSTLWYFKELHFLSGLYGVTNKYPEAVIQENLHRKRHSALWNDPTTSRLLSLVRQYPCFYDKNHIDYRSKEKRGEALQIMANELQKMMDVSTIQISKRISQLRFDYSKHKQERLQCEQSNKQFVPSYSFYQQMLFMDADIAPFKCEFCGVIMHTSRDQEIHMPIHQTPNQNAYVCPECDAVFPDIDQFQSHKQIAHTPALAAISSPLLPLTPTSSLSIPKEPKFFCDLCTASFREKANYDEHMRRHNDELLLPGLADVPFTSPDTNNISLERTPPTEISPKTTDRPFICDTCGKAFSSAGFLTAHAKQHVGSGGSGERSYRCDYPHCGRSYVLRQSYLEHMRLHYTQEGVSCDVCGKTFKSSKNLQNHKQIHDVVKRYICKICGSAFAQAAGLYLHKRRHTRNPDGNVDRRRGRQSH